MNNYTHYYSTLHRDISIPVDSAKYIEKIKKNFEFEPGVVYDIGSAVLHWTKEAKKIWPNTRYIAFEAVEEVEEFYQQYGIEYAIGVFSDTDNKPVTFFNNPICLGGNSYYKENSALSPAAEKIYSKEFETTRHTSTIDSVVKSHNFPAPDMLKIDVQGAELDILTGMPECLKTVKHIVVELQHVEYNLGARLLDYSIPFIENLGFELVPTGTGNKYFCGNGPDADYHFVKKAI